MCYPLWQSLLHIPWTPTSICHEWEKYPPSDSVCFHFQSSLCSGHFQWELSLTNLIEETKRLCPFFSLHTQNSPQEKEHCLNLLFPCSGDVMWHYIFIMYYITTYFFLRECNVCEHGTSLCLLLLWGRRMSECLCVALITQVALHPCCFLCWAAGLYTVHLGFPPLLSDLE